MAHPLPGDTDTPRPTGPTPPIGSTAYHALADDAGWIIGWSRGLERLLGHPADAVIGRSLRTLLVDRTVADAPPNERTPPRNAPPWLRALAGCGSVQAAGAGDHWSCVFEARHGDGHGVPVVVEATPMAASGDATQWVLSMAGLAVAPAAPDAGAALLRTIMERSPLPIAIWDTDLRCIWVNAAGSAFTGAGSQDIGMPLDEAPTLGFDRSALGPAMRRVLDSGAPVIDQELRRTLPDGEERALSLSMFRLDDTDGTPQGVCTIGIEVSDSTARQRLTLLNKAGTRVGSTLDVMTTAQELADIAVPLLADFVAIDLVESIWLGEAHVQRSAASSHGKPVCRRAGLASVHQGVPEAVFTPGEVVFLPPSSPMLSALTSGRSHFEPQLNTAHRWLSEDRERARKVAESGMHSGMFVPLRARGTTLGLAVFIRMDNPIPFIRDDLLLAEDLAARAALSLDNARRYARERNAALTLQRDLLPRRLSGGHGLDITSRYLPTDRHEGVGGDWYDAIPLSRQRVALVVGDVVGHGINAAAAMGRLRTAVHTLAALDLPPHRLLTQLDNVALRLSEAADDPDRFGVPSLAASCVYAVYDPASQVCTLARAGHPPPAVVSPDGHTAFPEAPAGGPVGWGLAAYESMELRLAEGSKIALFTDGLIETRRDDIDTGLARLAAALSHDSPSLDEYCEQVVRTMLRTATPEDDVSLLLARTHRST